MSNTRKRHTKTNTSKREHVAVQSNKPNTSPPPYYLILIVLLVIIVALTSYWTLLLYTQQPPSLGLPLPSTALIEQAQSYSYTGDMVALVQLIGSHSDVDWAGAQQLPDSPTGTLIHIALTGRHESVSQSSVILNGDHEGIIQYLVEDIGWNASYGCPVYFALHYKNLKALRILLSQDSLYCVTTTDTMGLTALHVAAKSKASGFARFYSKLFNSNGIIGKTPAQAMASVLGISEKAPDQPLPGSLSMKSLNDVILHEDITLILTLLSENNMKLSKILDSINNTVTHIAAFAGRKELVEVLLKYIKETGDDEHVKNAFGQTPQLLAELGGYNDIVKLFDKPMPSSVEGMKIDEVDERLVTEIQQENWKRYLRSGWTVNSETIAALKGRYPLCSEVLTVVKELTPQIMSQRKPILILSGEMKNWKALNKWKKTELIDRYGSVMFNVANIPYEDTYLSPSQRTTTRLSLTQYVNSFNSTLQRPQYLFDGNILNQLPQLMDDVSIPQWLNPSAVYLRQFILGGAGSGSPPHFHDNAVNGLVYGVKEWFLWRPARSFFTFSHVSDWKEKHYQDHDPPNIHCVQLPGDMVYVPQYWGHAVINIEESIGVAFEFW